MNQGPRKYTSGEGASWSCGWATRTRRGRIREQMLKCGEQPFPTARIEEESHLHLVVVARIAQPLAEIDAHFEGGVAGEVRRPDVQRDTVARHGLKSCLTSVVGREGAQLGGEGGDVVVAEIDPREAGDDPVTANCDWCAQFAVPVVARACLSSRLEVHDQPRAPEVQEIHPAKCDLHTLYAILSVLP